MIKSKREYRYVSVFQNILRQVELFVFSAFLIASFWILFTSFCSSDACVSSAVDTNTLYYIIKIFLPVTAIINSLRIALVFRLNETEDETEKVFYISLFGLAFCYILVGIFFTDLLSRSQKTLTDSLSFLAIIISYLATLGGVLADRQMWDKSTFFVKWRVSLCLIHLIFFLINPIIGVVMSILVFPACVMVYGGPKTSD